MSEFLSFLEAFVGEFGYFFFLADHLVEDVEPLLQPLADDGAGGLHVAQRRQAPLLQAQGLLHLGARKGFLTTGHIILNVLLNNYCLFLYIYIYIYIYTPVLDLFWFPFPLFSLKMIQANRNVASFNAIIATLQNDQNKIQLIRKYENTRKKIINNECAILFNNTCIPIYIYIYILGFLKTS